MSQSRLKRIADADAGACQVAAPDAGAIQVAAADARALHVAQRPAAALAACGRAALLCGVVLLLAGCQSPQPTGDAAAVMVVPGENTAELIVYGMGCPLCANNIRQQLSVVRGVEHVQIDLGKGQVLVAVKPERRPSRAQFQAAIHASGFTLVEANIPWATPAAESQPVTPSTHSQPAQPPTTTQPAPAHGESHATPG